MKMFNNFATILLTIFALTAACISAQAQVDRDFAVLSTSGSSLRFEVRTQHAGATLIVAAPDGRVFRREFKEGSSPEFSITDYKDKLPEGHYSYELRLAPVLSAEQKASLNNGRGEDDEPEDVRATRKRSAPALMVQSGGFVILNGAAIVPGQTEEQSMKSQIIPKASDVLTQSRYVTKVRRHHISPMLMPDQVIPDDLIVQGSLCVGLDCVNNESFGFDTIRLKENNTRIQFDDTSAAGFPTNNWQIRANSSAGGSENFLGFVDQGTAGNSETGTVVFQVDAGPPANSLRVSSTGRVGFRTGTPVLDLHVNTGDTPAHRLEQNNTGGFTAQTWDIAGNEANFFVRDVTGGSLLPLRIRPGAPTSSLDIAADGRIGLGTASPRSKVDIKQVADSAIGGIHLRRSTTNDTWAIVTGNDNNLYVGYANSASGADAAADFTIFPLVATANNRVGIRTTAPDQALSVNGDASKTGGGSWLVFSDERLKTIKGYFNSGLKAVMQLQPVRYQYDLKNPLNLESKGEHIGFAANALQKIIPEAVTRSENGYLQVNNDPIIWTMLNAIKEQQKEIEQLKTEIRQLRTVSRRPR